MGDISSEQINEAIEEVMLEEIQTLKVGLEDWKRVAQEWANENLSVSKRLVEAEVAVETLRSELARTNAERVSWQARAELAISALAVCREERRVERLASKADAQDLVEREREARAEAERLRARLAEWERCCETPGGCAPREEKA